MEIEGLLDNLETITNASGGIDQLRSLIYDLALGGKLVAQDPADEQVETLVTSLERERSKIEAAGQFRLAKAAPVSVPPFEPPKGWIWTRLSDLAHPQPGFAFKSTGFNTSGKGMPLVRIRDIGTGQTECFFNGEFREEFVVAQGDYLVGMDGNFNIRRWTGEAALLNQRVTRLVFFGNEIQKPFVAWALQAAINRLHGTKAYTTVQHLSGKQMAAALVCLPPRAEQQRIVAKVDELILHCDELEIRRQEWAKCRRRARAATISSLLSATNLNEVGSSEVSFDTSLVDLRVDGAIAKSRTQATRYWDFVVGACDEADDLRHLIIDLGSAGRMATNDLGDEPADYILGETANVVSDLIEQGRIRKPNIPLEVDVDSVPFRLPRGWVWARLGSVLSQCRNGLATSPNENGVGYPVLRISAGTSRSDFVTDMSDFKFADVSPDQASPFVLQPGDLLACRFNGNRHFVGRVSQVPDDIDTEVLHPDKLIVLRAPVVRHDFLRIALNSSWVRAQIDEVASTTAGNVGINGRQVQSLLVPIAPLAEQLRIASLVAQLFAQVASSEAALQLRIQLARRFSAAVVDHFSSSVDTSDA